MIEPPFRHPTRDAIDFIANQLGLLNEPGVQDWEFEVAKASDLPRYLALFQEVSGEDDLRFTLASMIVQAFEDADFELSTSPQWTEFLSTLVENIEIHAWQIWYWSNWGVGLEESWRVSPFMRVLCEVHFATDE